MKTLVIVMLLANGTTDRHPATASDCSRVMDIHEHVTMQGGFIDTLDGIKVDRVDCVEPESFSETLITSDGDCEVIG